VGHTNDSRLGDCRMAYSDILQFDGTDPFAARLDDILRAVRDLHVAVGVNRGDIASMKPAIDECRFFFAVVALHHPRSAHHEVTKRLAVAR